MKDMNWEKLINRLAPIASAAIIEVARHILDQVKEEDNDAGDTDSRIAGNDE